MTASDDSLSVDEAAAMDFGSSVLAIWFDDENIETGVWCETCTFSSAIRVREMAARISLAGVTESRELGSRLICQGCQGSVTE